MIWIKPAWGGDNAEDVWALYYYLLYQVLPFHPCDYLPKDDKGYFIYKNGDRSAEKQYKTEPNKRFSCCEKSKCTLACSTVSSYLNGRDKPAELPMLIQFVSPELYEYLYRGAEINRINLRNLLTTQTDEETLSGNRMNFDLNQELMNEAKKLRKNNTKRFESSIRRLLLDEVFDYDSFSKHELFPKLIQMLSVEVCPYCNRAFTTTARKKNGDYHRQNQIDHYRGKARYPWFALTLPNFVPACANCNQKKGNDEKFVLYPYADEFGSDFRFRTRPISGIGYLIGQAESLDEFSVEITETAFDANPDIEKKHMRAKASIEKFGLEELYRQSHNNYVSGIFAQRYVFGDAYIDSLMDSFPERFRSREEVRELLYLKKYDESSLEDAPLSKLTHDMDQEITELNN